MRRAIGRFYEGREPQQIEFNEHGIFRWGEIELSQQDCSVWNDLQQKLSTKSWKNIDAVFENPEMNQLLSRVLTAVVDNPLGQSVNLGGRETYFERRLKVSKDLLYLKRMSQH